MLRLRLKRKHFVVGEIPNMLVDEQFRKCVTFLFVDIPDKVTGVIERKPASTAFFVSVPIYDDVAEIYAVTARHVIEKSREFGQLYIRINLSNGEYQDFPAPQNEWTCHPRTDVAVIPINLPEDMGDWVVIPLEMLATEEYVSSGGVGVGDEVFFVGLFSEYSGQKHNKPIVRFGNVSLMHEAMPLKLDPGSDVTTFADAYLVESRSWGGHSGSPAFVYYSIERNPGSVVFGGQKFSLLGLVHGHHEIKQEVAFIGDILGSGKVPINAGIAVVIPAQKIIDTLMQDELKQTREELLKEHQKQLKTPKPDNDYPL